LDATFPFPPKVSIRCQSRTSDLLFFHSSSVCPLSRKCSQFITAFIFFFFLVLCELGSCFAVVAEAVLLGCVTFFFFFDFFGQISPPLLPSFCGSSLDADLTVLVLFFSFFFFFFFLIFCYFFFFFFSFLFRHSKY